MNDLFSPQFKSLPLPDNSEVAHAAARDYHEQCEAYDRSICGQDGRPKSEKQRRLISVHASVTRGYVLQKYRIAESDFRDALRALRMEKRCEPSGSR